jgi:hypothetical protein
MYWDVFKTAKLDSFKLKAVAAGGDGEGAARAKGGSTKSNRVQHTTHSAGKMPASFTSNSKKEQKMLAYVRDFQRVFQELYPHRCAELQCGCSRSVVRRQCCPKALLNLFR